MVDALRQRMYSPSFRISDPGSIEDYLDACGSLTPTAADSGNEDAKGNKELLQVIVSLATEVWRIQKYFEGNSNQFNDPENITKVARRVQAITGILKGSDFDVQDYDGQKHVVGLNKVNMVDQVKKQGINHDIIEETIKPSICYKGILVQRADVIVAVPDTPQAQTQSETAVISDPVAENPVNPQTETPSLPQQSEENINNQ
jgi:hypothetical protein